MNVVHCDVQNVCTIVCNHPNLYVDIPTPSTPNMQSMEVKIRSSIVGEASRDARRGRSNFKCVRTKPIGSSLQTLGKIG
jgi:hypothetical protein